MHVSPLTKRALALTSALWLAGCGGAGTRPDDMSAEEHRAHAASSRDEAERHRKRYDPNAVVTDMRTGPFASGNADFDFPLVTYNPTEKHLNHADHLGAISARHEKAARDLERFEDDACRRFPPKTRGMCPVMGPITAYQDIPGGVRLHVRADIPLAALTAHVQCHFAFGRAHGFQAMADCPLYLRGLELSSDASNHTIDLTISDAELLPELRRRAGTHAAKR